MSLSKSPNITHIHPLRFSVNQWDHLYSLHQAILRAEQDSGKILSISGRLHNPALLDHQDTPIHIRFRQVDGIPDYRRNQWNQRVLGPLYRNADGLSCELPVDEKVFEEMRRNLMEYADIEGIHIVVSLGLSLPTDDRSPDDWTIDDWPMDSAVDLVQLDYAMRGDA